MWYYDGNGHDDDDYGIIDDVLSILLFLKLGGLFSMKKNEE